MSDHAHAPLLRTGQVYDVVSIDGRPVIARSRPAIELSDDGRVSGSATVNRLMGGYAWVDDGLRLEGLATTMMAGPPEHMEQESRVLQALSGVLEVARGGADGEVVLRAESGAVLALRARRADPDVPS